MNKLRGQVLRVMFGFGCYAMALLFVVLMSPVQVNALGLGALSLQSHLHMALKADISLLLNDSDDMKQVHITLADQQEYQQLGLQWQADLSRLRVRIQGKNSAHPILQLRSAGLIHSPMLSVVLKAKRSGRGTYFKHYQLLLDPADSPNRAATDAESASAETELSSTLTLSEVMLEQQELTSAPLAVGESGAVWARTWRYGPVQAGDSLSEIAYRLRVDKRFSNKQVMLSMYEQNRAAFVDGNINHLIKGAWLTVPRADVVNTFSGDAAMQKLSKLLERENPNDKLDSVHKDTTNVVSSQSQALRYSGSIAMNGADGISAIAALETGLDQRFEMVHQEMMAGKLKMTSLDQTVSSLNVSMRDVKLDIEHLQQEINILKGQKETVPFDASNLILLTLVILSFILIGFVVWLILKRKQHDDEPAALDPDHHPVSDFDAMQKQMNQALSESSSQETDSKLQVSSVAPLNRQDAPEVQLQDLVEMSRDDKRGLSMDEEFTPLADEVVQLLNQTEASLGQCEFEKAEQTLKQIEAKWPDSLKALALKAQLYHETDRFDERNDLINSISEASDEQRWERFCYFLPSHVWNACFGGAA